MTIRASGGAARSDHRQTWQCRSVQNRWGVRYLSRADVVLLSCGLGLTQGRTTLPFLAVWGATLPPRNWQHTCAPQKVRTHIKRCNFCVPR